MNQPVEQKKSLQLAPDRTWSNKAKKPLLIALAAGIILVVTLLTLLQHQGPQLVTPGITKATPDEKIIDQAVTPPIKTPARTPAPSFISPPETAVDELYQKAMYALIDKHFQEAIHSFAELQTSNPEIRDKIALPYAEAVLGLADNLRKSNPQQAIKLFQKAIQLDPRSVRAHFLLGMTLTRQKDYAAAIASYQKGVELNPHFPDIFFNLGFLYTVSKDYAGAVEMYTRTVALHPDYLDEALFNLALAQNKLGKKEQSLANLKKALSVNPNNQAAQYYLQQLQGGPEE